MNKHQILREAVLYIGNNPTEAKRIIQLLEYPLDIVYKVKQWYKTFNMTPTQAEQSSIDKFDSPVARSLMIGAYSDSEDLNEWLKIFQSDPNEAISRLREFVAPDEMVKEFLEYHAKAIRDRLTNVINSGDVGALI